MSGDFETMPIGTARRIEELEHIQEVVARRPALDSEPTLAAKVEKAIASAARGSAEVTRLEAEVRRWEGKATEAERKFQVMRESMLELHSALSTCPGFKQVATREVWEALHDTFVAAAGRK